MTSFNLNHFPKGLMSSKVMCKVGASTYELCQSTIQSTELSFFKFFFFLMWIIFKVFIEFVTILFQYLYNIEYLTLYNIVTIFVTICFGFLVSGHVGC